MVHVDDLLFTGGREFLDSDISANDATKVQRATKCFVEQDLR
jgi:hypothetical protein